jgi:hypothetical protein
MYSFGAKDADFYFNKKFNLYTSEERENLL